MPGLSSASMTLNVCSPCSSVPAQKRIEASCSADQMTPSDTRNPATRSKSSPGERIVTENDEPLTRISRGSSTASASSRSTGAASAANRVTRVRRTRRPAIDGHLLLCNDR